MRLFFLLLFGTYQFLFAQNNIGTWNAYLGNFSINEKLNVHNEFQYRNRDFSEPFNQLIFRNGIGYNLTTDNNNLMLGYAFVLTRINGSLNGKLQDLNIKEHRVFQQFITKNSFERALLLHRYRIEQQIFKNDFQLRFRYFMALYIPLNHKSITKNTWYLAAYNEIFIKNKDDVFDQNRLSGAIGYALSKNVKVELGTTTQFFKDFKQTQVQVSIFNNLAFKHHSTINND